MPVLIAMKTKPKDSDEHYDTKLKQSDEVFCYSCGHVMKEHAGACPTCGVGNNGVYFEKKEKETAILISVFGSFFVYLYLYPKTATKFWIGLFGSVASGLFAVYALLIINWSYWYLFLIPPIFVWIFAIIDVAKREKRYFEEFPGG